VSSVVVGEIVMLEPAAAAAAAAALVIFLADMDPANVQTLLISASVLAATSASLYFGLKGEPVSCVKCGGNGEGQRKPLSLAGFFPLSNLCFFHSLNLMLFFGRFFFFLSIFLIDLFFTLWNRWNKVCILH
jgi:hypothetical protein